MRERLLLGMSLLLLLEGCSSSQQNTQQGPMPATPGITGNPPPVGPAHPMPGPQAMSHPGMNPQAVAMGAGGGAGMTAGRLPPMASSGPGTLTPLSPVGQQVVSNKPGTTPRGSSPYSVGGASLVNNNPPLLDTKLLNATWVETGNAPPKEGIVPTAATTASTAPATKEPERSDLMYASTAALVPPPPTTKEPPAGKEPPPLLNPARDTVTAGPIPPSAPTTVADSTPGTAPVLRTVPTKKFTLNFEMKDAAPGSTVEVWATQDQKVWKKVPSTLQPPTSLVVEAPGEGTYGLMLQVKVGSTPAKTPRTGDTPHIWIAVDTVKPTIELNGVDLSLTSKMPSLVVRWKAGDKNFGPRPISISYAEQADGPWIPLTSGVSNNGRAEIPVPAHLPRKMLVRLEATDVAGNVGTAQTPQPIRIELPWPPPATETAARPTPPPVVQPPEPVRPGPTISVVDIAPGN